MALHTAFIARYGIDAIATRRWEPFVEEGTLCVAPSEEGTAITTNLTQNMAPLDFKNSWFS